MLDFRIGFPLALRNAHARVCRICGVSDVILFVPRTVLSTFFTRVLNAFVSCYGVYLANFFIFGSFTLFFLYVSSCHMHIGARKHANIRCLANITLASLGKL